jgi:predicted nucleic acid-binding protein
VYLVDTSIWIEHFRSPPGIDLATLGDFDDFVVCLPIVQEVLQGIDREGVFVRVRDSMFAMPMVESPLESAVVDEAVDLYRRARRAGVTVRSSVDCLIAACALRHRLTVLHHDRDFGALARISLLEARDVPPTAVVRFPAPHAVPRQRREPGPR